MSESSGVGQGHRLRGRIASIRMLTSDLGDRCHHVMRPLTLRHQPWDWGPAAYTPFLREYLPGVTVSYAAWGHIEMELGGRLLIIDTHSDYASLTVAVALSESSPAEVQALAAVLHAGDYAHLVTLEAQL